MLNYDNILKVKKINFDNLDKDTLIDWEICDLGKDKDGERNWICVEVWLDESNKIKILEQNDYETEEITNKLTEEQKEHVYSLIQMELNALQMRL